MTPEEKYLGAGISSLSKVRLNDKNDIDTLLALGRIFYVTVLFLFFFTDNLIKVATREKMGIKHISTPIQRVITFVLMGIGIYLCLNVTSIAQHYIEVEYFNVARILFSALIWLFCAAFAWKKCAELIKSANDESLSIPPDYPGVFDKGTDSEHTSKWVSDLFSKPWLHIFIIIPVGLFMGVAALGFIHPVNYIPGMTILFAYYPVMIVKCVFSINGYTGEYLTKSQNHEEELDSNIVR